MTLNRMKLSSLFLLLFVHTVTSELSCSVATGVSVSSYGLGNAAADGINYKGDQTGSNAQGFHCTCQDADSGQGGQGEVREAMRWG